MKKQKSLVYHQRASKQKQAGFSPRDDKKSANSGSKSSHDSDSDYEPINYSVMGSESHSNSQAPSQHRSEEIDKVKFSGEMAMHVPAPNGNPPP